MPCLPVCHWLFAECVSRLLVDTFHAASRVGANMSIKEMPRFLLQAGYLNLKCVVGRCPRPRMGPNVMADCRASLSQAP